MRLCLILDQISARFRRSIRSAISFSHASSMSASSRLFPMEFRQRDLTNFNLLKLLSSLHTVGAAVSKSLYALASVGNNPRRLRRSAKSAAYL